jgi:PadR family transcriptional regulator PadR
MRLSMSIYLHILPAMRRKAGTLVPLEVAICVSAVALRDDGNAEFHGYAIARELSEHGDRRLLTAYGTLYRALARLEAMGLLQSRWEDPQVPARENRPGRRLYALTGAGEAAAREVRQVPQERAPLRLRRRPATT